MEEIVGTVRAVWRFPVKSMRGEQVEAAELTADGFAGDRAYALVDAETGKVVSAKSTKAFPDLLGCRAAFVEPPRVGGGLPAVRIELADGSSVASDDADVDAVLARFFGRPVRLESAAPKDFTIDYDLPDLEGLNPAGQRDVVVEQKLGAALFSELGLPSPVGEGAFFDMFPVSVLTTSTLARLDGLAPGSRFDERRFRMNVVIDTEAEGFVEHDWLGHRLEIGSATVSVTMNDPRCVMTTLAQDELQKDSDILRTLTRHNRRTVAGTGLYPCCGVYAVVGSPGTVRTGDPVVLR